MRERGRKDIILFEQYVPFAMTLEISNKYKEALYEVFRKTKADILINNIGFNIFIPDNIKEKI